MPSTTSTVLDVAVVGAGVLGASVFHHLVKAGYQVGLLEKDTCASGCTAWSGGIVRCFHTHSDLSDKALWSWQYYKNFEQHTGEQAAFKETGFLYFPALENLTWAEHEVQRLSKDFQMTWLLPDQLKEQFAELLAYAEHPAVYEPHSGYMNPVLVTDAWIRAGQKMGGSLYEQQESISIDLLDTGRIRIRTAQQDFETRHVVIACGASTPSILDQLRIPHDLYAQIIQVDIRKPAFWRDGHPAFIDDQFHLNGRPDAENKTVYIGHPTGLRIVDINQNSARDLQHSERIQQQGRQRWSWVEQSTYTQSLRSPDCYSPDGLGRVMKASSQNNIWLATGFSGGGFKMAPWVGKEMVALIKEAENE